MADQKPYNEKEVLELLAQDSQYAFGQLFDRHHARVYSLALRFLKSPQLAEEVVQEVFLKVWLKRTELKNILKFEPYLYTMTKNQVFEDLNTQALDEKAEQEFISNFRPVSNNTDYLARENQYEQILRNTVNLLPPQRKKIFELAKIEGLSHERIAAQLNISTLTVKDQMKKALRFIRQHLEGHIGTAIVILKIFED